MNSLPLLPKCRWLQACQIFGPWKSVGRSGCAFNRDSEGFCDPAQQKNTEG